MSYCPLNPLEFTQRNGLFSWCFWLFQPVCMHRPRLFWAVWGWCKAVSREGVQQCLMKPLEPLQFWVLCSLPGQSSTQQRGFFSPIIMKKEVAKTKWSLVHLAHAAWGWGNSALGAVTPEHIFAWAPTDLWLPQEHYLNELLFQNVVFYSGGNIFQDSFLIYAFFWHFLAAVIM